MFNELSNSRNKDYVFSWDKVLTFEGETGPYVQYTHARASSLMRKAGDEALIDAKEDKWDQEHLSGDSAYRLSKLLYGFPSAVREAGERYEPSVVARHIVDVAQAFNRFYHEEHILVVDQNERAAKIALVVATKEVLKNGLSLLGVHAPEKM